jgi:hypothetical protein
LIAAQRFFEAMLIAFLPSALSFRFAGNLGAAVWRTFKSCSMDGTTAFRPEPTGLPRRLVGPVRASIALVSLSLSLASNASMWSIAMRMRLSQ